MGLVIALIFLFMLNASGSAPKLSCSAELTVPTYSFPVKIVEDKYISVPLDFTPNAQLREKLEAELGHRLLHRGESHITIVTPSEYDVLKTVMSPDEIRGIIQSVPRAETVVKPVCIGKAETLIEGRLERAYFVVVEAPVFLRLRRELRTAFVNQGGKPDKFKAEDYYPHITLGFTKRDLHEADRVTKGLLSCEFMF